MLVKSRYILLCFLLFKGIISIAQEKNCAFSIEGKVLDAETKHPISYVNVRVSGTEKYGITNEKGDFTIEGICNEDNTLIISCLGYCESVCKHHHHPDNKTQHIYLKHEVYGLDDVVIVAEKGKEQGTETIAQVAVKKEDFKNDLTQSLAAVISKEQGVSFQAVGTNVQRPIIHGLSGNRVLILNNGLKHGFQNWGDDHAPEIDINSAEKITIVKGAAGVRFGPEALAGAIIVESNHLHLEEPFYANVGSNFQTNGRGGNLNFGLGEGFQKWSYFFNGNYTKIGDRRAPGYNLTNTGKEEQAFGFGTRYYSGNFDFKFYYSFLNQNLAVLRASFVQSGNAFVTAIRSNRPTIINPFSYDINEPNQETQHHFAKAEVSWRYSDEGKLIFRGGRQFNTREEFDVRRNFNLPIIDLDLSTSDYQLEWKHPNWHQLDGFIGAQAFTQNSDNIAGTLTTPFIPNYNTTRLSAFAIESLTFGKNTLEAGVRFDYESNDVRGREQNQSIFRDNYDFTNVTASLGYVRKLSDRNRFRSNLATAWRTPNVAELFSFGQTGFRISYGLLRFGINDEGIFSTSNVTELDNSNVAPEVGYKFTNELELHKGSSTHIFTLYSHYIENFVYERPVGFILNIRPAPGFIFVQDNSVFAGLDYSWRKQWSSQLLGTFGLSYLWSRNVSENEPLINQPPLSLTYELGWNFKKLWRFESSKLSIKPSYTFEQFDAPRTIPPESLIDGSVLLTPDSEIFDFKDAPSGYFLLDISWQAQLKNWNVNFSVKNAFNTTYRNYLNRIRYFADEPGINFLLGVNYAFQSKKVIKNHEQININN